MKETIRTACVLTSDGKPILCKRHGEGIRLKMQLYGEKTTAKQQGFRTSKDRFVSRRDAFRIAKEAGQLRVIDGLTGETIDWKSRFEGEPILYSEDLR